jgi:hypothetical protein
MSGEQRLLMACEMTMFARDLAQPQIRREHPEGPEHNSQNSCAEKEDDPEERFQSNWYECHRTMFADSL